MGEIDGRKIRIFFAMKKRHLRRRPKVNQKEGIGGNVGTEESNKKEEGDDPWWRRLLEGKRDEGRKKERKIYGAARCRLTTGSVRLPTKPLLHAISSTILPRVAPFALRSLERPPLLSL